MLTFAVVSKILCTSQIHAINIMRLSAMIFDIKIIAETNGANKSKIIIATASLLFITVFPACAHTKELNFQQFGGMGDGKTDNADAFKKAFHYAENNPNTTITINKGIYRTGGLAYASKTIKSILHIKNAKNLTLNGSGAEIIFTSEGGGIFAENSPGLTINKIIFDYDPTPFNQGSIIATANDTSILVSVDDKYIKHNHELHYNAPINVKSSWLMFFDSNYDLITGDSPRVLKTTTRGNNYLLTLDKVGEKLIKTKKIYPGIRYVRTIRNWGHLLRFHFVDNAVLNEVKIYSSSGFAGLFTYSNNTKIINSSISRRPNTDRLISTSADGWHFIGAKIGPQIMNNNFENLADDAIVLSVRGSLIEKIVDDYSIILKVANPIWYNNGDEIEIIDWINNKRFDYTIEKATPSGIFPNLSYNLRLNKIIDQHLIKEIKNNPDLIVFDKSEACNNSLISNNNFYKIRARGILLHAKNVTITNNTFAKIGGAAISGGLLVQLPFADDMYERNFWAYGPSDNITIEQNNLNQVLNWGGGWGYKGAINFESLVTRDKVKNSTLFFDNIKIANNTINCQKKGRVGVHLQENNNAINFNNKATKECNN